MAISKLNGIRLISDILLRNIIHREQVESRKVHMFYGVENIGASLQNFIDENKKYYLVTCDKQYLKKLKDDYKNNLNIEIIFKDESIFQMPKDVEYVLDTTLVKHYEIDGINDLLANMEGNVLVDSLVTADFIISTRQNTGKQWILENRTLEAIIKIEDEHVSKNMNLDLYIITISKDKNKDGVNLEKWVIKESGDFKKEVLVRSVDDIKKYGFWDSNIYFNEDGNKLIEYLNSERHKSSIRELSEVISRGKTVNPQEYVEDGNYKVLNIGDIQNGNIYPETMKRIQVEDAAKFIRYELQKGDIVISCRGTINKCAVFNGYNEKVIASAGVIFVRPNKKLNPYYLQIFLQHNIGEKYLDAIQGGATVKNLNSKELGTLLIPYVSFAEQTKLVDKMMAAKKKYKEALDKITEELENTKKEVYEVIFN